MVYPRSCQCWQNHVAAETCPPSPFVSQVQKLRPRNEETRLRNLGEPVKVSVDNGLHSDEPGLFPPCCTRAAPPSVCLLFLHGNHDLGNRVWFHHQTVLCLCWLSHVANWCIVRTSPRVRSVRFVCGCVVPFCFIYLSSFHFCEHTVQQHKGCELELWRDPIPSADLRSVICWLCRLRQAA